MLKVKLISVLILFTSLCQVWTSESFNDFPLTLDYGDYIIHATLTDQDSGKMYHIEEYIHSFHHEIKGKISISSSEGPVHVHYSNLFTNERSVIKDYDCELFKYNNKWDKMIMGINKPLLNHILLVGPSLIYRLGQKYWQKGENTDIRGTTMHSAYTTIGNDKLTITYYYKSNLDPETGRSQPSRITFSGHDPSDYTPYAKQNLILDIYVQTKRNTDLDKVVGIKPGIGCPVSIEQSRKYLKLVQDSVHFISIENVNGLTKSSTRNEIYADEQQQLVSLKTTSQGITTEAIYDYNLEIIYKLRSDGGCLVSPMELKSLDIYINLDCKPLNINHLLDTVSGYRYIGKSWFEPGSITDVWESVNYNHIIKSGKYEKVVKTLYTIDSKNGDTSLGIIPMGVAINAYNKDSTGKYQLIETTKKYYYDFGEKISDEEYESRFRISDCYPDPSERKTLAIQFNVKDEKCGEDSLKYIYTYRDKIKSEIIRTGNIAASRIGNIDIVSKKDSFIAYVTFLNLPDLSVAFKASTIHLSSDVLKYVSKSSAKSATDCLKQNANAYPNFEAVVYCHSDKSCARISKISDLVEDDKKGISCTIYNIPFKNLRSYNEQPSLENIHNIIQGRELIVSFNDGCQAKARRVEEVTEPESKSRQLFTLQDNAFKLVEDGKNTIMATGVNNLADCYRGCANLDENQCETFSFCQFSTKIECLLSTSIYKNLTDKAAYDSHCQIYSKNHLEDYVKIANREYINPTSIATNNGIDDCANNCYNSAKCFSFQVYDNECRLEGDYSDSATRYSKDTDIYIPKMPQIYTQTGKKIVTSIYHTELGLTLDECADLCDDFSDDVCISFNYCPKGLTPSSCSLSKYSVKDSSAKTIDSDVCTNYKLSTGNGNKQKTNKQKSMVEGTSGGAAFGIIMLFIAIGLTVGATLPFAYKKTKSFITNSSSFENDTFNWNIHTNEDTEQSSI